MDNRTPRWHLPSNPKHKCSCRQYKLVCWEATRHNQRTIPLSSPAGHTSMAQHIMHYRRQAQHKEMLLVQLPSRIWQERNPTIHQQTPNYPQLHLLNPNNTQDMLHSPSSLEGICHLGMHISMVIKITRNRCSSNAVDSFKKYTTNAP